MKKLLRLISVLAAAVLMLTMVSATPATTATTYTSTSAVTAEEMLITRENEKEIALEDWLTMENAAVPASVSSTSYDSMFTCYDPGTSVESKGNGVAYSKSYCAGKYGGIDQANYLICLE